MNPSKVSASKRPAWGRLSWTLFITGVALLLIPVVAVAVNGFTDVPVTHTHAEGIGWVAEKGITVGYDDGTFRPDNPVTRGQMGTFLHRNAGVLVAAGATVQVPVLISESTDLGRWFNNINGTEPAFNKVGNGRYELDFGFDLSDRFVQVTPGPPSIFLAPGPPVNWATARVSDTTLRVYTYYFDGSVPQLADANVHILIY